MASKKNDPIASSNIHPKPGILEKPEVADEKKPEKPEKPKEDPEHKANREKAEKQDKGRERFVERKVLCAKHFDLMMARETNLSQATARLRHYARANGIEWDRHVCCAVGDGIVNDAIQGRPVKVKPHQDPTKPTKIKKTKTNEASEIVKTKG